MMFRRLAACAVVLAATMALPAVAMAADAFTTSNANVRAGPGAGYPRIGMLAAGTPVSLRGCEANWCNIRRGSLRGWVAASLLAGSYRPVYRPPVVIVPPPIVVRPPHWNRPPPWQRPPQWNRPPHRPPPNWGPPPPPPQAGPPPRPPRPGGPPPPR